MKKIFCIFLTLCILICATACSNTGVQPENQISDNDFATNFESLSLSKSEYKTVGELVSDYTALSDDSNTCMVHYDSISENDVKELEATGYYTYNSNKSYKHVKFTHIADYQDEIKEYNFVASMDENGNVIPELLTYSSIEYIPKYATNPQVILNGLDSFARTTKAMVNLSKKYP